MNGGTGMYNYLYTVSSSYYYYLMPTISEDAWHYITQTYNVSDGRYAVYLDSDLVYNATTDTTGLIVGQRYKALYAENNR